MQPSYPLNLRGIKTYMKKVTVAAVQISCSEKIEDNIAQAEQCVIDAAQQGAQIILLPELFASPYFCKDQNEAFFSLAHPVENHPFLSRFATLAKKYQVVLPISFFERANQVYYNSIMIIDADGEMLGVYRKTHIPDGAGYQEKFYFAGGDTGFKVWQTRYACIGVGICWDQWFPEAARSMALQGAELLFYHTAIRSEPEEPELDSAGHWQRVMQGHAGANVMPVVASNRIGEEQGQSCALTFYGTSFITDATGQVIQQADRESEAILLSHIDLEAVAALRTSWGIFRDRRPEHYQHLLSLDGK